MKLLWVSNAPGSHSGYGSQTRQVGRRLLASGIEVEFSANDGTRGSSTFEGALVRGSGSDRYSRDKVREDFVRSGADWAVILYDPWVYTQAGGDPFGPEDRVAGWVPVDHYPAPPSMHQWLSQHYAIAMSRFGEEQLKALSVSMRKSLGHGFEVRYAPHAIEPDFAPRDKSFREQIAVPPDAFLVGIVAANTGQGIYDRKGFGDMFQATATFMDRHPDAFLYVHTLQTGYEGIHLPILASVLGMDPARIRWADQYRYKEADYSDEDMASAYSAFDVLLATSRGEGFGIPVIEAQACGTPVIVSNWTAQTELVADHPWDGHRRGPARTPSGWLVSVQPDYDSKHAAFFGKPHLGEIALALEDAYGSRGELREGCLAKAAEYGADAVFERYWRPILADFEDRLRAPNRHERRSRKKLRVVA